MVAWRRLEAVLALVIIATVAALSSAQQTTVGTLPALPSCPPAPLSLSPCIGYVFGMGSATLDACCHQLRTFVQAQAPCICAASKLAPIPVGVLLGQAQGVIPNVCNLPNPCDDATSDSTAPAGTDTSPPAFAPEAPAGGQAPTAATATPSATPASATSETETPAATTPDDDLDDDPPAETTPEQQVAPAAGIGSKKLPELLHAAGAKSSKDTAAGTLTITLFLASVATIYM